MEPEGRVNYLFGDKECERTTNNCYNDLKVEMAIYSAKHGLNLCENDFTVKKVSDRVMMLMHGDKFVCSVHIIDGIFLPSYEIRH